METAESVLRLDASWVDYLLVAIYFLFVLGIGWAAKARVSSSIDFFLSGRGLPAWVTGLAFVSANLGAVEIIGMSANGVEYGFQTMHYFWIGAIPAMVFLGIVMMPFYYGSGVRSVPEFMKRRFGTGAHLVNAISFALAQVLIAGVNLFLLAKIVNMLLGWDMTVSTIVAAVIVLSYITLGGLSAAIYNEVLQFFVIVAALLPLTFVGLHKVGGYAGLKEKIMAAGDAEARYSLGSVLNHVCLHQTIIGEEALKQLEEPRAVAARRGLDFDQVAPARLIRAEADALATRNDLTAVHDTRTAPTVREWE